MKEFVRLTKSNRKAQRDLRYRDALAGKTVLITGASRGIGAAAAVLAGNAGARVLLAARGVDALEGVARRIREAGAEADVYPVDLSELKQVDQLAESALADHGAIDIVVHNAARSIRRPTAHAVDRFHDYERTMRLNYFSPVRLTLRLLPSLIETGGTVSLVLSMGVFARPPNFGAYVASKCALDAFGDVLVSENHHKGLHVSSVYLPLVRTDMAAPTKEFADRVDALSPERAARMVLDGIVERKRRVLTKRGRFYSLSTQVVPMTTTRVFNLLARTYPVGDEPSEFPAQKALLDRFVGGHPF